MNKEILDKIDEINNVIESSKEYQKYLDLKKQIEKNKELNKLINEVRVLQKDVTHKYQSESFLLEKMNELNEHPLYREYTNTLDEINNCYAIIETSLNNYFMDKLN